MSRALILTLILSLASTAVAAPNDPLFSRQWSLANDGSGAVPIELDDLHTRMQKGTAGVDIGWLGAQADIARRTTSPVIVAVIDSGLDLEHPDLAGRVAPGGWDFLRAYGTLSDDTGHGTHVSGIIAANANNDAGIAGIAPASVRILPLRVLSTTFKDFTFKGKLISDYVADAIRYAVTRHASVINISLGWPKLVDTENARNAVKEAIQAGTIIVVSAGNDRKDLPTYPCAYDGVLCVGAISNTGAMSLYSNLGGLVDVLAPGDAIVSTFPAKMESRTLRIQGYESLSGTSQAAPHVSAIAATLRSVFPNASSSEIIARILASASALPEPGSSLYGSVHLARALSVSPQPVFLPDFKSIDEIPVDEDSMDVQGSISFENLWQSADDVSAQILINGKLSGVIQHTSLGTSGRVSLPWSYHFDSMDDSSILHFVLQISAAGKVREFATNAIAVRPMEKIRSGKVIAVPALAQGAFAPWLGTSSGHLYSSLVPVSSYGTRDALPSYYEKLNSNSGSSVRIFDASRPTAVTTIQLPSIQKITQVIRMDAQGDGSRDWVMTGYSQVVHGKKTDSFFEFDFLNENFQPLWGESSRWRVQLDPISLGSQVLRDYSTPGSWIRSSDGKLLPAFVGQGVLPNPDNYNALDPRHSNTDTHLYYVAPKAGTGEFEIRALDGAAFRKEHPSLHILSLIPSGTLRLFVAQGDSLNATVSIWAVRSVVDSSISSAPGWDIMSASGQSMTAHLDLAGSFASFNMFDGMRGSVSWGDSLGTYMERREYSFESAENPVSSIIGAFALPGQGRFWFAESSFDLVAFHEAAEGSALETRTIPIGRDSSFPGEKFSEMLSPALVGTSAHPLPGVYIDSTLVRGSQVSVAVWNQETLSLEKPLRYSLAVPASCVEMSPVTNDAKPESFALPLFCGKSGNGLELRLVYPSAEVAPAPGEHQGN